MNGAEIINKLLIHYQLNPKSFSEAIGLERPQAIYDIQSGKTKSISSKMADKIISAFPEINRSWLLAGEGEMLHGATEEAAPHNRIRYWVDVDATAGGVTLFEDQVTDKYIDLDIPEFHDCTDAVNLYGDSMLPLYKSGQIIILKEWMESFIDYGNVYLVITKRGNRMVKYLRKGSDAQHVLCVSENKNFDPFEIEKDDILRLYLVKGGISKNTL